MGTACVACGQGKDVEKEITGDAFTNVYPEQAVGTSTRAANVNEVDLDKLFEDLRSIEGNQTGQDALFERLKSHGACMIVSAEIEDPDPDPMRSLTILKYLRALYACRVWNNDVRLVKADANRFFIFAVSPGKALRAAFTMRQMAAEFDKWIVEVCPDIKACNPATLKAGIHDGGILLMDEDCFGDPVNVASKLGEDIAQQSEIMVSKTSAENSSDTDMQQLKQFCTPRPRQTEISGLTLDYFLMEMQNAAAVAPRTEFPNKAEIDAKMGQGNGGQSILSQNLVIMTTDMSGFTRLTKKYGILHFLRLVLETRSIILPAMERVGGWRVKYEGDNIIAAFKSVDDAVIAIKQSIEKIAEYNKRREKDFQVRIGYSLDVGEVRIWGHDIVGTAFDNSFKLAEDVAEVGEVLVTERVKAAGWPSSEGKTKLSDIKTLEGSDEKYYVLSFP